MLRSVEQIQTASQAGQTGQAAPKTVGDKILEGMRSYGADFSDNMSKAEVLSERAVKRTRDNGRTDVHDYQGHGNSGKSYHS